MAPVSATATVMVWSYVEEMDTAEWILEPAPTRITCSVSDYV